MTEARLKELAESCSGAAARYKRRIAGSFVLVSPENMRQKLAGHDFCVTRKIDGMLAYAMCDGDGAVLFGSGGRDLSAVPVLEKLAGSLRNAGISKAEIACELYAAGSGRSRVGDVTAALADPGKAGTLRLAPFDIVSLDGTAWHPEHYRETLGRLNEIFLDEAVRPVEAACVSAEEVPEIYSRWVEEEGAEGLVAHSEMPMVWKIKPRHSIDAAVVGFTEQDGAVRDLLFAVRRTDGLYQVFCTSSNGLSDAQRAEFAAQLGQAAAESAFVRTDSRGVAYRMVRPQMVMELSVGELVSEDSAGKAKRNPLAAFDGDAWTPRGSVPGVSVIAASIIRVRSDKDVSAENIRVSQLSDICPFAEKDSAPAELPRSELLRRRVFRKTSKDKVMLQKFLMWKTNKQADPRYPAYVFYYVDYSSGRKDALKRDLRVSDSEEQITAIFDAFVEANVKKGWAEV